MSSCFYCEHAAVAEVVEARVESVAEYVFAVRLKELSGFVHFRVEGGVLNVHGIDHVNKLVDSLSGPSRQSIQYACKMHRIHQALTSVAQVRAPLSRYVAAVTIGICREQTDHADGARITDLLLQHNAKVFSSLEKCHRTRVI